MNVIAKAYDGEPLSRILTGCANGLAYIINPSVVACGEVEENSGVGFPTSAVFAHDAGLLSALESAWQNGDRDDLVALWSSAIPLGSTT